MQRDARYDVLKGIAIIMMVAFHAQMPECVSNVGRMFHMAVFFILAGWFFSERHYVSFRACVDYWKSRMIRLWWPCVLWSVVFILLRNAMASAHLIHDLSFWETAAVNYTTPLWSRHEVIYQLVLAPLMLANATPLAGAFWFLQTLLFASVGYCVVTWALKSLKLPSMAIQSALSAIFFGWSAQFDCKLLALVGGPHTLVAYAMIHIGVLLRKYDLRIERLGMSRMILTGVGCLTILVVMSRFGTISLAINKYPNPIYLLVASVLGWYFLCACSSLIRGRASACLAYIGSHTMPIVILHYAAFKLVNVVLVLCHNAPFSLASNVVAYVGGWYWLLYTMAGVCLPLILNEGYRRLSFFRCTSSTGRISTFLDRKAL